MFLRFSLYQLNVLSGFPKSTILSSTNGSVEAIIELWSLSPNNAKLLGVGFILETDLMIELISQSTVDIPTSFPPAKIPEPAVTIRVLLPSFS